MCVRRYCINYAQKKLTHLENIQKYEVDHPLRQQQCELAKDELLKTSNAYLTHFVLHTKMHVKSQFINMTVYIKILHTLCKMHCQQQQQSFSRQDWL